MRRVCVGSNGQSTGARVELLRGVELAVKPGAQRRGYYAPGLEHRLHVESTRGLVSIEGSYVWEH